MKLMWTFCHVFPDLRESEPLQPFGLPYGITLRVEVKFLRSLADEVKVTKCPTLEHKGRVESHAAAIPRLLSKFLLCALAGLHILLDGSADSSPA